MRYAGGLGAAAAAALLAGCPHDEPGPGTLKTKYIGTSGYFTTTTYSGYYSSSYTTGTTPSFVVPVITFVQLTCAQSQLEIYVETSGWTGDGLAYLVDATTDPPWPAENHSIASFEFGQNGQWDHLKRDLAVGYYGSDTTTGFTCADVKQDRLMLAVEVFDVEGNPADCVFYGAGADDWDPTATPSTEAPAFDTTPCHAFEGT